MNDPLDDFNDPLDFPPSGFGNGMGGMNMTPPVNPQKPQVNRMELLNNLYRSVFGRTPDSNAVMYYMGLRDIDENQIRKQMVESGEHAKMIEDSQKLPALLKESQEIKEQSMVTQKTLDDKLKELENLNKLLYEKNQELIDIKQKLVLLQKSIQSPYSSPDKSTKPAKKKGIFSRIL